MGKAVDLFGYKMYYAKELNKDCFIVIHTILFIVAAVQAMLMMLVWYVQVSFHKKFKKISKKSTKCRDGWMDGGTG